MRGFLFFTFIIGFIINSNFAYAKNLICVQTNSVGVTSLVQFNTESLRMNAFRVNRPGELVSIRAFRDAYPQVGTTENYFNFRFDGSTPLIWKVMAEYSFDATTGQHSLSYNEESLHNGSWLYDSMQRHMPCYEVDAKDLNKNCQFRFITGL